MADAGALRGRPPAPAGWGAADPCRSAGGQRGSAAGIGSHEQAQCRQTRAAAEDRPTAGTHPDTARRRAAGDQQGDRCRAGRASVSAHPISAKRQGPQCVPWAKGGIRVLACGVAGWRVRVQRTRARRAESLPVPVGFFRDFLCIELAHRQEVDRNPCQKVQAFFPQLCILRSSLCFLRHYSSNQNCYDQLVLTCMPLPNQFCLPSGDRQSKIYVRSV